MNAKPLFDFGAAFFALAIATTLAAALRARGRYRRPPPEKPWLFTPEQIRRARPVFTRPQLHNSTNETK